MPIQNFLDKQPAEEICHNGEGRIKDNNPISFFHKNSVK